MTAQEIAALQSLLPTIAVAATVFAPVVAYILKK